jgi:hypothetical protein
MSLKLAQDVWYELWEEAGKRGLDTWYVLEERGFSQDTDPPLGEDDRGEAESDAGGG